MEKAHYDLALLHKRNKWGFAVLGVLVYYSGLFVGAIAIGVLGELTGNYDLIESTSEVLLGIMALPVGILATWGLHKYLKSQWSNTAKVNTTLDEFAFE